MTKINLLVISSCWDLAESEGTSTQVTNLLTLFQKITKSMVFLAPNFNPKSIKNPKLSFINTYTYPSYIFKIPTYPFLDFNPFFKIIVEYIITKHKIDTIFISYPWAIQVLKHQFPQIKIIYGANGYERLYAKIAFSSYPEIVQSVASILFGLEEKNAVEKSDLVISVSSLLTKLLINNYHIPEQKICTIPMGFDYALNEESARDKKKALYEKYGLNINKKYFVFHGGLIHPANAEAVRLIKQIIAPEIQKFDENIEFCVIGKRNPNRVINNIHFFPFIEKLDEILQLMTGAILPILSGSGIRVKAMDYIRNKLPIISTITGISGYGFTKNEIIITKNEIDIEFIQEILKIAKDQDYAKRLVENCLKKVRNKMDNKVLLTVLQKALDQNNLRLIK